MKTALTVACTLVKSTWQAVSLRSALTALLLMPLAALHAAERAAFVREPHVVIKHGVNDGRYFIGPGMFVLKDGSVLMAAPWGRPPANVFEGIVNKHPVPLLYRSTDAGETWQELGRPEVKWRHSGFVSDGGVSFLRLQDGRIAMVLHRHAAGLKGGALPVICFSSDEGKTWTDPALIGVPGDEGAWYVMNDRLIQTRIGRLVLPVAHAVGRHEGDRDESLVFFSDDGGASWKRSKAAPLPEGPRGMAEPCVVELNDGRLMLLARGGLGVLVKSYSSDGGDTWTQGARTTLVSPCSSLTLHRLPDSRLIVFYNHATPYNAGDFFPRNPLCYALSADEGDSWSGPVIIDDSGVSDGNGGKPSLQLVYPGAAFVKEGILLFYSRDVTKNTFKTTKGETFAWTEAQRALTGGVTCLLEYPAAATKAEPAGECDICIYGGTSGGVVAAVQAARMGKSVVLIEPGRHLGGMMAGGLSWSDVGSAERAKLFGGLAREVFERIGKHYGQDPKTVFDVTAPEDEGRSRKGVDFIRPPSLAFEPKVAEEVFTEMAREAGVQVRFGAAIESVAKDGTRFQKLKLNDGTAIAAKVFMDATYEGDLMARAGVSYTLGRESNAQYGEKGNGVRGPEHGPSSGRFTVKVDPFVKPGDPASGLLPLISGEAPESVGSADKRIQSYNYRLCLTDDPTNRAPLDPPANYDAAHWELLGRYIEAMKAAGTKLTLRNFCKYDPLPNRKYDFNNRWPISTDLLGGADGWPEGSVADRARIAKAHEDYLRGFFHFLRTDPRVPENVREETSRFGLPRDEFTDNGHWPYQIYVREARRMVSDLVMTEHHIRNQRVAPNPVSLATYPMDIHAVRRVFHEGKLYNEGFGEGSGKPAPVGYGAIVPKASECENLFVTFALSASHAAFGSIRMEPVFMVTSQSAATAACLAIEDGVPVQSVDYAKLKTRLLADKAILDPSGAPPAAEPKQGAKTSQPRGLVLDDTAATFTGTWADSSKITPLLGTTYRTAEPKKAATAVFTPEIPVAGCYEVRLLYTAAANRTTKATVTVQTANAAKTFTINQRLECLENGIPRALGVFDLPKGKITVALSNKDADGFVALDGLQLVLEEAAKAERAKQLTDSTPAAPVKIPPPMLLKSAAKPQEVNGKSYDLVVVGATPGGIACAVRAAREGLSVLLVNHTQHLGGFVTSGAGGWEAPYDGLRSPIYGEMLTGAAQHYAKTYGEGSPQHIASMPSKTSRAHIDRPKVEPRIAELLFNQMVEKEKTLTVLLGHIVTKAERDGAVLQSVTLKPMHGEEAITVRGQIFVDGMYEGDLMAVAGVKTQIGRESRTQYGEKHAGVIYTTECHKEPGQRGFPKAADEGTLNIRYNSHATAEIVEGPQSGEADSSVMAYNYRLILTRDPANQIKLSKPANFDVEIARAASGGGFVPNLPNDKVAWNGGRLIGPQNDYPAADWPTREAISKRYLDAMLMRLWWMQNDPEAPEKERKQFAGYGLAADEFPDNHHAPYEIYVREARRLVGRYVFKEQDNVIAEGIARTPIHADSIAMTDWPVDSVACLPRKAPGGNTDGILFLGEETRPAQVPYRSMLANEIDNLLVPVAISASHVGWGAIRLEPCWMQLGESAGHAAALSVKGKTTAAKLPADILIRKLASSRVMISFFNDVDVTSDDPQVAAAQYFGTKGFFASYDAKLNQPLTEAVKAAWQDGFEKLRKGTLEPMQLAKAVHDAEAKESTSTIQKRGEYLLQEFNRIPQHRSVTP